MDPVQDPSCRLTILPAREDRRSAHTLVADPETPHAPVDARRLAARRPVSTWVLRLVVALGIALRIREWAGGRSFWLDEVLLIRAISQQPTSHVLDPLARGQAAPPGWLLVQHGVLATLGDGERALRMFPLALGCAGLVFGALLAQRLLSPIAAVLATLLIATSPLLIYYSNEFKQYSSDVCCALLLILLGVRLVEDRQKRRGPMLWFAVAAAVTPWFSHAAILVAGAVFGAVAVIALARRDWSAVGLAAVAAVPWLGSVGIQYVVLLSKSVGSRWLQTYWNYGFPPRPLSIGSFGRWLASVGPSWLNRPLVLNPGWLVLALAAVGLLVLAVRIGVALLVLAAPALAVVVASAARQYPMADRLILFLVPLVLIVMAASLDAVPLLLAHSRRAVARPSALAVGLAAGLGLSVLGLPQVASAARQGVHARGFEELRPVLARVAAERRPRDGVFALAWGTQPLVQFYGPRLGLGRFGSVELAAIGPACRPGRAERALRARYSRVWIVYGHYSNVVPTSHRDLYRTLLDTIGRRLETVTAVGASADLYDLTRPPTAAEPPAGGATPAPYCLRVRKRP